MIATELRPIAPETTFSARFVEQLLAVVSSDEDDGGLFRAARDQTGCDLVTVFTRRGSGAPICLVNSDAAAAPAHTTAARAYCERHFRVDPVFRHVLPLTRPNTSVLVRYHASDANDAAYRRDCYEVPRLSERIAQYFPTPGGWTWLNVYRKETSSGFSDAEVAAVTAMARIFVTAVLARPSVSIMNQLAGDSPLSTQEHEVLRLSLGGATAEAIAHRLGVAPSTVTTYRKRAYQKLNVRNQRELLALRFGRRYD